MTQQPFNIFLTESLTAVGEDIYNFVDRTIQHYQEELGKAKRENTRLQQLLDLVYKPNIRLHRTETPDATEADVSTPAEDFPEENSPEQQCCTPDLCQDKPETSKSDDEQMDEIWINHSEGQLSSEESNDEDALTKELIKTVQQLEDRRATEEGMETKENPTQGPKHTQKRLGTTFYRCHICKYMFTKKILLTWHQKMHQNMLAKPKGNILCNLCGNQAPCQTTLQSHRRVHTEERAYFCLICGDAFHLKRHMTKHIRTHAGEEPFSCHSCTKSYNKYSALKKHVLARHSD